MRMTFDISMNDKIILMATLNHATVEEIANTINISADGPFNCSIEREGLQEETHDEETDTYILKNGMEISLTLYDFEKN